MSSNTTMHASRPADIELPLARGVSETFTDVTACGSAIKVPSCRPTPLIGSWADESWPLNSRQASEIITEQVLQRQRSSAIFEDDQGNVLMESIAADAVESPNNSSSDYDENSTMGEESLMQEAMSHAQNSTEVGQICDHDCHIAQSFRYDPYSLHTDCKTMLHRCSCEVCIPVLQQKHHQEHLQQLAVQPVMPQESASNQVTPEVAKVQNNQFNFLPAPPQQVAAEEQDWDLPQQAVAAAPVPVNHQFPTAPNHQQQQQQGGFMTHTQLSSPPQLEQATPTASPGQMQRTPGSLCSGLSHPPPTQRRVLNPSELQAPAVERDVTAFMPPPPPPRIATLVFEEEGNTRNPSGVYYHLVMRWYSKVQSSQGYFVTADQLCPAPNKEKYSFEQWADQISGWWYTHFEHMQKKAPRFARRR